jgi:hypothetical protein
VSHINTTTDFSLFEFFFLVFFFSLVQTVSGPQNC